MHCLDRNMEPIAMEGNVSTMDSISDQHTSRPGPPETTGDLVSDEGGLAPSTHPPSDQVPGDDQPDASPPELRVVPQADSISDLVDTEAFDTGVDRIDQPDFDSGGLAIDGDERTGMGEEEPIEIHPHRVVEAILFAADSPMPPAKIAAVLGVGDARDVRKHVEQLNTEYIAHGLAFRIEQLAGGYQILTLPAYNPWLRKLLRARQETRLSPAALETLAILAYKQPCTRAEVEAIRGVAAGDLINRLREMNLVKIVGRAEDLGRPLLYGTTKRFLEVFGLPSLEELPQVEALSGGGNGTVRETAKMPAAALANGAVEEQRTAEKMRDAQQIPDSLPEEAPAVVGDTPTPVTAVSQESSAAGDPAGEP
jgi:segregation and condensation protein B